eukprot:19411-Prorocentrum_lima.AAC.1
MISATAADRASRALRSKTRQAVQVADYKVGDQIEFWKQPLNKDLSGWRGPATVVHVKPDGNIHMEWQGNVLIRHCSHVRRAL